MDVTALAQAGIGASNCEVRGLRSLPRPLLTLLLVHLQAQLLNGAQLRELDKRICSALDMPMQWLKTCAQERNRAILPNLIGDVERLAAELNAIEHLVPRRVFSAYHLSIRHIHEDLGSAQNSTYYPAASGSTEVRSPQLTHDGLVGRPRFDIDEELLTHLLRCGMIYKEIAGIFGVHHSTIGRHARRLGVAPRQFCAITREDLIAAVDHVLSLGSGESGYRWVWTTLTRLLAIPVRRDDVQLICAELNPSAVLHRYVRANFRRKYQVPWVNSLWHMDGHHKLIRWKIVIHGAMDGHSRRMVFLQASNNNKADTVTAYFQKAVEAHGWPSRIRVDYGGENLGVKDLMEAAHGTCTSDGGSAEVNRGQQRLISCRIVARDIYSRQIHTQPAYRALLEGSPASVHQAVPLYL